MLMAPDKPHDRSLSEQADKVFEAVATLGSGWHGRAAIAGALGKARLNAADVLLLEYLVETRRLEVAQEPARGPIGYAWKYRLKGGDDIED